MRLLTFKDDSLPKWNTSLRREISVICDLLSRIYCILAISFLQRTIINPLFCLRMFRKYIRTTLTCWFTRCLCPLMWGTKGKILVSSGTVDWLYQGDKCALCAFMFYFAMHRYTFFVCALRGLLKNVSPFWVLILLHYNVIKSCDIVFYCTLSSIPAYIDIQLCDL